MKIGILTFHRARNYGAVLQCYALFYYLTSLGHDVEVVDYYPQAFRDEYSLFSKKRFVKSSFKQKIRMIVYFFRVFFIKKKRIEVFDSFVRNKLTLSFNKYDDTSYQNIREYDILFFGSDQIWNPQLTNGFDHVYTGNFNKGETIFVAYAASTTLSKDTYSDKHLNEVYRTIVNRFDFVSTRELEFQNYLNSFKLKEVIQVLDPVFLLNKEQWSSFSSRPKETNYLLLYCVPFEKKYVQFAKKIAKEKGLKLIEIASIERPCYKREVRQTISPMEFVGYFLNASYVVTSSFHGTAFSIILKKSFVTIMKGNMFDGRAYNLLQMLGLENRAMGLNTDVLPEEIIYSDLIMNKLREKIELSLNYIFNAILRGINKCQRNNL